MSEVGDHGAGAGQVCGPDCQNQTSETNIMKYPTRIQRYIIAGVIVASIVYEIARMFT